MSDSDSDSSREPAKPYIAIVVLVCGVIGGLIVVISFIFFCKFCFKKSQPLASTSSPTEKNEPYAIKPKNPKQGYQILDGTNSLASPVPADLETYLQQPISTNNNNLDLKPEFLLLNQSGIKAAKESAAQKKLCQLADDELLIVQTEVATDEKQRHHRQNVDDDQPDFDSLFRKCSLKGGDEDDIEVLSIKHAANNRIKENHFASSPYVNSKRQRAFSNAAAVVHHQRYQDANNLSRLNNTTALAIEDPIVEARRRSFDERLSRMNAVSSSSPTGKRRLPNVAQINDYYASQYDRKQYSNDTSLVEDETQMNSLSTEEVSLQVPPWSPRSPHRTPGAHLPRSHQIIADKSSPRRKGATVGPSTDNLPPKLYPRDHRNAKSYGVAEQDLMSGSNKMYSRDHRLAFSFTDTGEERLPVQPNQPIILLSPDHRSEASMTSGIEAETINRFYRQCQEIFNKQPPGYVSALSSSSSGNQFSSNGRLPSSRLVKSVEIDGSRMPSLPERQAQSLDNSCKVCLTDAMNRLALYNEKFGGGVQSDKGAVVSSPLFLTRQRTMDETDYELEHLDDAQSEEIKAQCKNLWSLRSMLEDNPAEDEADVEQEDDVNGVYDYQLGSPEGDDGGGTTSYTTSFESNTEPLTMEDYLRSTRTSGPFLEPPRLSLEAKRAKLKNLYAKRQLQLQQQGISVESYESYDTVDSSESSKPEQVLTSFESNQGEQTDSTVDSRRKMVALQKDSGYKSQSMETSHVHDQSFDKIILSPSPLPTQCRSSAKTTVVVPLDQSFDSNVSDLAEVIDLPPPPVPAPSSPGVGGVHGRKHYARSRERDAADAFFEVVNGNDTDSKSDQPSGESFDDPQTTVAQGTSSSSAAQPTTHKYPNVHLARMRRSYESPSAGNYYRTVLNRDYTIDAQTDAIYRDFVKFDPVLEGKLPSTHSKPFSPRPKGYHPSSSTSTRCASAKLKQKGLSTEDSIEEEYVPNVPYTSSSDYGPRDHNGGRYDIPIIKLSDDNELFAGVKVQ